GRRLDAFRPDHVFERDRNPLALAVDEAQEAVQLGVALVDRGTIGVEDLLTRDLSPLEQAVHLLGGHPEGVDGHTGGTPKNPPSGAGAFASAAARARHGAGSSSATTLTRSSGCDVGGTPARSSSETLPTA